MAFSLKLYTCLRTCPSMPVCVAIRPYNLIIMSSLLA